jgi:large subunit ribosomal protein L19
MWSSAKTINNHMNDEQTQAQNALETQPEPVIKEAAEEKNKKIAKAEMPYKTKLIGFDELRAGQTIKLYERIKDITSKGEEKERLQIFEGIILGVKGAGVSRTLTIRKVSEGVGVEKIYPVNSPIVAKIELVKTAKVRRAKLNFLNDTKMRFKRALKETYVE